ncbi:MAG: bifunctional (p)ppGpp synthetase/guanosine-3',5'-bis(diphosphate) 3'-pyrophosphohydrolase [Actinomycetota bacterium]|jgi:GTP pyrophosphokinase|nr:bifunctional (p)ppGpp synthetase/guanosine-3',5'-bis(diphosphate) 3'-pyrophosphohydrolase [Actinomycetota bacterium]
MSASIKLLADGAGARLPDEAGSEPADDPAGGGKHFAHDSENREGARANGACLEPLIEPLLCRLPTGYSQADLLLVREAAREAAAVHAGQYRRSGEPYITHPVAVAGIVADLGVDAVTVASALLHDAVEDTALTTDVVQRKFGVVVASVVDGVTKLDRLQFDTKEEQQAATVRKMLVAMATDWRVLLIKLADRLHNMQTLAVMPEWKQRRTAQETIDIYAPLAHRLGVQQIRWQLEDLSFATLHPKRYAEIEQMVAVRAPQREEYLARVLDAVRARMTAAGIDAEVTGRPKHLWSIYEKMVVRGKEFDDIHDLVGIRVHVATEKDCWAALGAIHAIWPPVQGRFKDYVNSPKFNLYQSLHTTVIGLDGKPIEVQVRTPEMHQRAEHGIAAHWSYKEGPTASTEMAWMQRIADADRETSDPVAFLEALKLDLQQDEVYVFTPKGRVISLPARSTPVDFAYAIHTEVGHRCIGAKVNGRLVPLDTVLSSADTVEIVTSRSSSAGPTRDWLYIVASARARTKIRQWFSRERREDAIDTGREELARCLRRDGMPVHKVMISDVMVQVARSVGLNDAEALYAAIGEGQVSAQSIVQRLARELRSGDDERLPTTAVRGVRRGRSAGQASAGIYVEGLDDVMVHLARCCTPVPGDQIIGFVTQGRGISVHRADCSNAVSLSGRSQERLIEVEWDRGGSAIFLATLELLAFDRERLLADVSRVVSEHHLNIVSARTVTTPDQVSRMAFDVELADPSHLHSLLAALKHIDGVFDVYRQLPGRKG